MAQIIEKRIFETVSGSAHCVLFDELENAFNWLTVYGTDDEKVFKISANLAIKCTDFATAYASGSASSSSTASGKIYAVIGTTDVLLAGVSGVAMSRSARGFRIVIGAAGDLALQVEGDIVRPIYPMSGCGLVFAIVNVQNTVNDSVTGYGIYRPKLEGTARSTSTNVYGGINYFTDATPKFLYTDDTEDPVDNGNLQFVTFDPNAKITALMPIVCVSSECVSTSAYVPIISKPDIQQGYVEIERVLYYNIGGLYFIETSQEQGV